MPEFLNTHQNLIRALKEANPSLFKLACDLVESSIRIKYVQEDVIELSVKFSQRYSVNPYVAQTYVECAMWSYFNNYMFETIKCKLCNDFGYVQIAPNARGMKKCICQK